LFSLGDLSQNNSYYDFMYENTTLENGAFVGGIGLSLSTK